MRETLNQFNCKLKIEEGKGNIYHMNGCHGKRSFYVMMRYMLKQDQNA